MPCLKSFQLKPNQKVLSLHSYLKTAKPTSSQHIFLHHHNRPPGAHLDIDLTLIINSVLCTTQNIYHRLALPKFHPLGRQCPTRRLLSLIAQHSTDRVFAELDLGGGIGEYAGLVTKVGRTMSDEVVAEIIQECGVCVERGCSIESDTMPSIFY